MGGILLVIVANSIVLFVFFVYFRRRIERALQSENVLREIRTEVDQMIVELNQTTDRNVALVEDHLTRLAAKIEEADRRIVVLKKETERVKSTDRIYTKLRPVVPPAVGSGSNDAVAATKKEPVERKKSVREQVLELYRSGLDAREISAKLDKTLGEVELIITLGTNRA